MKLLFIYLFKWFCCALNCDGMIFEVTAEEGGGSSHVVCQSECVTISCDVNPCNIYLFI